MCLYPTLSKNKKYQANKKNNGKIPEIKDIRTNIVPIGCGNCIECKKMKAREWQVRLSEEIKDYKNGIFVTLTFSDEKINELKEKYKTNEANELAKIAVRKFLDRWIYNKKTSVRHWLVTELGHEKSERIHLHGILFTNESKEEIERIWENGFVGIGDYVNQRTINYITKYILKIDNDHKEYKPIILNSKGTGIGYIKNGRYKHNIYKGEETRDYYILPNGQKINLPIYYRNKIYTEEQREQLWINKINENKRYVYGNKITNTNTKKGNDKYFKALDKYRVLNEQQGYGKINWNKKKYMATKNIIDNLEN